jgi:hypothetical protein
VGHVASMEKITAYKIGVVKPVGKRPLMRKMDTIKMDNK